VGLQFEWFVSEACRVAQSKISQKPRPLAQNARRTGHPALRYGESMGQPPYERVLIRCKKEFTRLRANH
jgi:hypothetical protein